MVFTKAKGEVLQLQKTTTYDQHLVLATRTQITAGEGASRDRLPVPASSSSPSLFASTPVMRSSNSVMALRKAERIRGFTDLVHSVAALPPGTSDGE